MNRLKNKVFRKRRDSVSPFPSFFHFVPLPCSIDGAFHPQISVCSFETEHYRYCKKTSSIVCPSKQQGTTSSQMSKAHAPHSKRFDSECYLLCSEGIGRYITLQETARCVQQGRFVLYKNCLFEVYQVLLLVHR